MRRLIAIFVAGAVLASCGSRPEATLEATVTGVPDGTKVYLLDGGRARVDSTLVAGGAFRFDIAKAVPDAAYIEMDCPTPGPLPFFVEPGVITGELAFRTAPPAPPTGVFTGTPSNDAQNAYAELTAPFNERMSALVPQLNATHGTPDFDPLYADYEVVMNERRNAMFDFLRANAATVFAASQLWSGAHAQTTPAEIDSLLAIVAAAPDNAFIDRLRERRELLATTAVGAVAPDFTQAQPDGTPLALSSLRGKLVLIDFWASWCGPCRVENPNVVKMYNRLSGSGFEILGVSLDSDRDAWLKAIDDDGLTWKHVSDLKYWSNAVAQQYAVRSIPHTVLVGPDGTIIAKNLRGAALEARVAQELGL